MARSSMTNAASNMFQHLYMFINFYSYPAFYQHVPHLIFIHFLYIFIHFHSFSFISPSFLQMFQHVPAPHPPFTAQAMWQINGAALWSCCPRCWQALRKALVHFLDFSDGNLWDIYKSL